MSHENNKELDKIPDPFAPEIDFSELEVSVSITFSKNELLRIKYLVLSKKDVNSQDAQILIKIVPPLEAWPV